jgi:metal-responsive CopG/Arc/MetJ family transcriptional regulator
MDSQGSESVIIELDRDLLKAIDHIRVEWGIHSRAGIIERILREVLTPGLTESQLPNPE